MARIQHLKAVMKAFIVGLSVELCAELLRMMRCQLLSHGPYAIFTGMSIVKPLAGILGGPLAVGIAQGAHILLRILNTGSLLPFFHSSVYQIPLFCASLYWVGIKGDTSSSLARRLLMACFPLACLALFVVHPVGSEAWTYGLLWLIPVATLLIPHRNRFFHALGSTFFAHAAGSLQWLFAYRLTAEQWVGLIPIALVERFAIAAGMVICLEVVERFMQWAALRNRSKQSVASSIQ